MPVLITVYEEYANPAEKRAAQRGAKLGKPTGKARGYFFAFPYQPGQDPRKVDGAGCVDTMEPGADPTNGVCSTSASPEFLRTCCRRVGGRHLPPAWKKIWENLRKPD